VDESPSQTTERVNPTFVWIRRRELVPEQRVALLVIHQAGIEVREIAPGAALTVGREAPSDVCVDDATLSRRHARFVLQDDGARLDVEDLGSTNGTWLAGRRVERAIAALGDEVMLGGVLVRARVLATASIDAARRGDDDAVIAGPAMTELLRVARRVASSRIPVILTGETGTGKEVLARYLHDHGASPGAPMISVNCGAIPRDLIESTFFGHERGAFTGAQKAQPGVFESAADGTVFLDEIGELPLGAQVALLRVLESRCAARVGSTKEVAVTARVVAATHRDLATMVDAGEFRRDLYFRLSTVTLDLPPLRARPDDVEPLAEHFLRAANAAHGRQIDGITPAALARLRAYDWPGNARELRNVIERAVVLASADVIDAGDLPDRVRAPALGGDGAPRLLSLPGSRPSSPSFSPSPPPRATSPDASSPGLRERVQVYETQIIREALDAAGGSRREAARLLGMPLRTLASKIKTLGISEDD